MKGNLPEKMNGADAAKKLEWIDKMLKVVEAEERDLERDGEKDEDGDGNGDRWTKRVFWDEWREQIWKKACEEVRRGRGR